MAESGSKVMAIDRCRRAAGGGVCNSFIILRELIPLLIDLDLQFRLIEDEGPNTKVTNFFCMKFFYYRPYPPRKLPTLFFHCVIF